MPTTPALTPKNERIRKLAGCTPLALDLRYARAGLVERIRQHRDVQAMSGRYRTFKTTPAQSRARVIAAAAKVRAVMAQIERTYGHWMPEAAQTPAQKVAA